jgi:ribonuclease T2
MRRGWFAAAAALWLSAASAEPAVAPADFDFYVLALSWSPGFCDTAPRRPQGQCDVGARLGFVVHGLWPNSADAENPRECTVQPAFIPGPTLAEATRLYPSRGLAIHEWRAHGTCTGLDAAHYFDAVKYARDSITIPEKFARPSAPFSASPREIVAAFVDANDKLTADSIAVACQRGELTEVRFCMTRDLIAFERCPRVLRSSCRDASVSVAPVR